MTTKLKIIAYLLFSSRIFNDILKPFAYLFLRIKHIERKYHHIPQVVLTIDCESGFLENNKRRRWMFEDPEAFQGYYFGIRNILNLLDKYGIKATFFLSTQCFASNDDKVILILNRITKEGHELGIHLHPKEDRVLKNACKINFNHTGAQYYEKGVVGLMITKSVEIIKKYLGSNVADSICSLRWANFALDLKKTKIISKYIRIDSSICPGCSGHNNDDRKFNWSNYKKNYIHKIGNLVEVPISTFNFLGWRQANPSLGALTEVAFNKYNEKKISPFVLLTHSSECTNKHGVATYILANLERFILNNQNKDIKYSTLKEVWGESSLL